MKTRPFWTRRRCTGIMLIVGSVAFQVGAWGPLTALTDKKGTFVYSLPPQGLLGVVFQHPMLWWGTNALFIGSSLVTLLGLALLARMLQEGGDRIFSHLGLLLFTFGAALWCIQLTFRLSVDVWAAQNMAKTGILPTFYTPLSLWTQALFVIYTILTFCALALYGSALLTSQVLPHWIGWLALAYSLAGLGIFGFTGDAPPFLHYILPLLMGVLLLGRHPRVSQSQDTTGRLASLATEPS